MTKINNAGDPTMAPSEIKLEEQEFNNMDGREAVEKRLNGLIPEQIEYEPVDLTYPSYWANKNDTLVISFNSKQIHKLGPKASMDFAVGLARLATEMHCDEFDTLTRGDRTIVRIWWD